MSQENSEYQLNKPVLYKLHIDQDLLSLTKQKLQLARFPDEPSDIGDDDWSLGAKVKVVRRLANYWKDGYDWRAEEVFLPSHCILQYSPFLRILIDSLFHRQRSTRTLNSSKSKYMFPTTVNKSSTSFTTHPPPPTPFPSSSFRAGPVPSSKPARS